MLLSYPFMMWGTNRCDHHHGFRLIIFELCTIFWYAALSLLLYHTHLSVSGECRWRITSSVSKPNHTTNCFKRQVYQYRCNYTSTHPEKSIWLTLAPSLVCYSFYNVISYRRVKWSIKKSLQLGNPTFWARLSVNYSVTVFQEIYHIGLTCSVSPSRRSLSWCCCSSLIRALNSITSSSWGPSNAPVVSCSPGVTHRHSTHCIECNIPQRAKNCNMLSFTRKPRMSGFRIGCPSPLIPLF
jgi:hypothetical protein